MSVKNQRPYSSKEITNHLTSIITSHNEIHLFNQLLSKRVDKLNKRVNILCGGLVATTILIIVLFLT